jgi:3-methyladenine DNA glycosylase AlkD
MTVDEVMAELERLGNPQQRKTFLRHGGPENMFGVKIADLKVLVKKLKVDHPLALGLYATGNSDAMYLAGLIADPMKMTKADLEKWVKQAGWSMIAEYTVPWTAAESRFGRELAVKWMGSKSDLIAAAGWNTYSSLVSIKPDDELDTDEIAGLLERVRKEIGTAPNRVKYTMNGFVIAVGASVASLTPLARKVAADIGTVHVEMGDTSCKVPLATEMIRKVESMGRVGKKRATAKC